MFSIFEGSSFYVTFEHTKTESEKKRML